MITLKGRAINEGIVIGRLSSADALPARDDMPIITYAEELMPNQVLRLCKQGIKALLLTRCSDTSHAAILARGSGFPSLFGITLCDAREGCMAILDGYEGVLIVDPDEETLLFYQRKQKEKESEEAALNAYKGKPSRTRSGTSVSVCANINKLSDLDSALKHDAEGVFFKTEFLFLESDAYPSEDEQFAVYRRIAEALRGRRAVIRTIDIGADKTAPYFLLDEEENPALGLRGIRLCLAHPSWFMPQLRAILRASAFGRVAIMFPMIASVQEVIAAKRALNEAMLSLEKEKISYDAAIEVGIMVETPAAALLSEELAREVDFFSIGTNDLIQYTLAADRQNPKLRDVYDPYHPAVMRLVKYVIESGVRAGIEVGISGELGSDLALTERFLSYGMKTFAVPPAKILHLRKKICETE